MEHTALLVVSFGSTHLDTLERCICATEETLAKAFPELSFYRAFTSNTVIRRLKEKQGISVDTVQEALQRMKADGVTRVVVQPTLILAAIEYDLLKKILEKETEICVEIGRPLLQTESDCRRIAEILQKEIDLKEKEALVLMGHGTEHQANDIYSLMQKVMDNNNFNCVIGTVEGTPTFEDAVKILKERSVSRAKLLPLMFVAGDHAKNDMAGEEDDSLRSLVEAAGIMAEPLLKGLGESEEIRNEYVLRAKEAFDRLNVK